MIIKYLELGIWPKNITSQIINIKKTAIMYPKPLKSVKSVLIFISLKSFFFFFGYALVAQYVPKNPGDLIFFR